MQIEQLLRSYVNDEKLNFEITDDDLKILIEQSLQTLVYPITNDKKFKKYYISWVLKQEEFYNIQNELTYLFNSKGIKHVFFKGAIISRLYTDNSVRTRGDIDFYVENNDFINSEQILINNGFVKVLENDENTHHHCFKKNSIEVEVHFNMLDPDSDKSWIRLFKSPFDLCDLKSDSLYEFKPTYHLIYCIMHFAHHLRHGAGIRYILDFYYMFKKTKIDFDLLHKLINECNLKRLYSNIINVERQIFNEDFDNTIEKEDVKFFIDYMMSYGIHGHSNNKTSSQSSIHKNRLKFFLFRVFMLPKNYRISVYPVLGKHWYLYPICLFKHWLYLITHKLGSFFKFLFGKNKNKDLYNKLGV